jgi:hypothetical protein
LNANCVAIKTKTETLKPVKTVKTKTLKPVKTVKTVKTANTAPANVASSFSSRAEGPGPQPQSVRASATADCDRGDRNDYDYDLECSATEKRKHTEPQDKCQECQRLDERLDEIDYDNSENIDNNIAVASFSSFADWLGLAPSSSHADGQREKNPSIRAHVQDSGNSADIMMSGNTSSNYPALTEQDLEDMIE